MAVSSLSVPASIDVEMRASSKRHIHDVEGSVDFLENAACLIEQMKKMESRLEEQKAWMEHIRHGWTNMTWNLSHSGSCLST